MTFIVSAKQIVIMFLLMLLGFLTGRLGMIHKETAKDLTNFLLYIISPCLIVNAYLVGFSVKRLIEFFQAIVAVTLVYSVSIIVSHLIINKKFFKDQETRSVLLYGSAYSNAGFMGIPLVSAILGESAVFFSVPYLVVCNFFMWTHGVALFSIEHKRSLRLRFLDALKNPNVIAAFIGFVIFVSGIKLPELVLTPIKSLVSVNTPLSMVVVGTNLGAISFSSKKNLKTVVFGTFARNILIPLICLFILLSVPISGQAAWAILIMASCPVPAVVVLFSLLNNFDTEVPTSYLCLSTLCTIFTLPLIILVAQSLGYGG